MEPHRLEKVISAFHKIKATKEEKVRAHKEEIAELDENLDNLKSWLLDYCKENDVKSLTTEAGRVTRTTKTKYWASDWEAMHDFIINHRAPELLNKAINQSQMAAFLEEHPDLHPPGLNADTEYAVSVYKPRK